MERRCTERKSIYLPTRYLLIGTAIIMLQLASEVSANALTNNLHNVSEICMDTQRALKNYAQIGMNVSYHDTLQEDLSEIEKHINNLKMSDSLDKKISSEILEIEKIWTAIKPKFQKKPFSKEIMHELHEVIDEDLTERCEKIIAKMAINTGIKGDEYVVQIDRLGVESQRLVAMYLLKAWGIDDPHYEKIVQHTLDETDQVYEKLMSADKKLVSKEIKEKLTTSKKYLIVFGVMTKSTSGHFMPVEAAKMADELHDLLSEIVHMQRTLVEGSVSYFTPIADEKYAGKI